MLKVWRDVYNSIANPGGEEEGIYDEDYRREKLLRNVCLGQTYLDRSITPDEVFTAIWKLKCGKGGRLGHDVGTRLIIYKCPRRSVNTTAHQYSACCRNSRPLPKDGDSQSASEKYVLEEHTNRVTSASS